MIADVQISGTCTCISKMSIIYHLRINFCYPLCGEICINLYFLIWSIWVIMFPELMFYHMSSYDLKCDHCQDQRDLDDIALDD